MNTDTEATFVRRKFTITDELDTELEQMAENNYQGNVSLCLRQSIADHRETLNGNGDLAIRRLVESIAHVEDRMDDLTESVNSVSEQARSSSEGVAEIEGIGIKKEDTRGLDVEQIVAVLNKADTPLRVADIIEHVEMQPIEVQQVLGYLIDHGHVFATSGDPPRYHLAKIRSSPNRDQNQDERGIGL